MKRMSSTTGQVIRRATATLGLSIVLLLGQSAWAQDNCRQVEAAAVDVFSGGNSSSGNITHGGFLNGTRLTVYRPGGIFTQDPNVVTFLGDMTLTTKKGQLKTSNVYLLDIVTQHGTALFRIDPGASTGRFAGATGLLFLNVGKAFVNGTVITYLGDITGKICFANQEALDPDDVR